MRSPKIAVFLCFGLALIAMARHAAVKSPTYDEPGHIQAGFYHWRHHDMERGLEHPPFLRLWAALPLNFLDLTDPQDEQPRFLERPLSTRMEQLYGTLLIYKSPEASAERILFSARAMMIMAALLLLALIYRWAKELYGDAGGLLSLFLAATFPPLLGHGTLVNTDVGGAATALLFLYALSHFLDSPSPFRLLYCGFTLGVAQASKLSNLILVPVSFFLIVLFPGAEGGKFWKRTGFFIAILAAGIMMLNAFYRYQNVLPPHEIHPHDLSVYGWGTTARFLYRWAPLPEFYLMSLGFMDYHVRTGFAAYLFGQVLPHGVWYYFPALFLVRTPTLALAAFGAAVFSFAKAKIERREFVIVFPAVCYLAVTAFSKLNLGIRHLLFIYPFLFILAGRITVAYPSATRRGLQIFGAPYLLVLFLLHAAEIAWVSPHYLAFYNFFCGGPRAGIYYSSDMDYGQDLSALGDFMKMNPGSDLILSYFGTGLPAHYGLAPQELLPTGTLVRSTKINGLHPSKEFLAASVSQIQGLTTGRETFGWLRERKPVKILGYSIHVYDITGDRDAHERLAVIYEGRGEKEKAQRERERARILS